MQGRRIAGVAELSGDDARVHTLLEAMNTGEFSRAA
jgi:hypothetical protein